MNKFLFTREIFSTHGRIIYKTVLTNIINGKAKTTVQAAFRLSSY